MQLYAKSAIAFVLISLILASGCATPPPPSPPVVIPPPQMPLPPLIEEPPPSRSYSLKLIEWREKWRKALTDTPTK